MKLKTLLAVSLLSALSLSAADTDLRKGLDLTSYSFISPATLNQLVDNGTIATNKGLLIITNVTPDTLNNPRYTNWIWLDISVDPPIPRTYSKAQAAWFQAGIGPGQVTASSLAPNSVTTPAIAPNAVVNASIASLAIANANIQVGAVSSTNIQGAAIVAYNIQTNSIDGTKMGMNSISSTNIVSQGVNGTNIANNTITSTNMAANSVVGTNIAINAITSTNLASSSVYGTNVANATLTYTNSATPIATATASTGTNFAAVATYYFISSTNNAIPSTSSTTTIAHGLGVVPASYRIVFVCQSADASWAPGNEIDSGIGYNNSGGAGICSLTVQIDATNIILNRSSANLFPIVPKGGGAATTLTVANWSVRVYAVGYK